MTNNSDSAIKTFLNTFICSIFDAKIKRSNQRTILNRTCCMKAYVCCMKDGNDNGVSDEKGE